MIATVEVDRLGRLVIPKKMRDALHLRPGEKLDLECNGERLVMSREHSAKGLYMKDGWLVYDSGGDSFSAYDVRRWMEEDRNERMDHVSGSGR